MASSLSSPYSYSCSFASLSKTVGILGGGQLGRMITEEAKRINLRVLVLDPAVNAPAAQVGAEQIVGSFSDESLISQLVAQVDVLTVEIEHVNADALLSLQQSRPSLIIQPAPATIKLIQDKFTQKQHLLAHNIAVGPFMLCETIDEVESAGETFGYPFMLKSRLLAYDGKGNAVVKSKEGIDQAILSLKQPTTGKLSLYAEQWVPFAAELAVMVARSIDGQVVSYPCVQTIQQDNICHTVIAPAPFSPEINQNAQELAERAISSLSGAGIFGVEMFLQPNGSILLNEIAPRPHNSGHYTIEACEVSQFQQHLRCILGMSLGPTTMKVAAAVMINVLGTGGEKIDVEKSWISCGAALTVGAAVHWYGKKGVTKGRKLGHITFTGGSVKKMEEKINAWKTKVKEIQIKLQGVTGLTDNQSQSNHENTTVRISNPLLFNHSASSNNSSSFNTSNDPSSSSIHSYSSPLLGSRDGSIVGIIMGSDSDLPTMRAAAQILTDFNVPFELTIVSAHRTPHRMVQYANTARQRGLKVIIAAAGGAAHLPGMVAALTSLPVIGVPIPLSYLDGQDSLYSIVQMPRGIPVATVAIGNSTNAALLAIRMLSVGIPELGEKMENYLKRNEEEVIEKVGRLAQQGWKDYK